MTMTLQVTYPTGEGTTFDYDYYNATHLPMVSEHMGAHISEVLVAKGLAGGPDTPPGYFVIATMTFEDKAALDGALAASGPVVADIENFYNAAPQMLIGEVIS